MANINHINDNTIVPDYWCYSAGPTNVTIEIDSSNNAVVTFSGQEFRVLSGNRRLVNVSLSGTFTVPTGSAMYLDDSGNISIVNIIDSDIAYTGDYLLLANNKFGLSGHLAQYYQQNRIANLESDVTSYHNRQSMYAYVSGPNKPRFSTTSSAITITFPSAQLRVYSLNRLLANINVTPSDTYSIPHAGSLRLRMDGNSSSASERLYVATGTDYTTEDDIILLTWSKFGADGLLAPYYYNQKNDELEEPIAYFSNYAVPTFTKSGTALKINLPNAQFRLYSKSGTIVNRNLTDSEKSFTLNPLQRLWYDMEAGTFVVNAFSDVVTGYKYLILDWAGNDTGVYGAFAPYYYSYAIEKAVSSGSGAGIVGLNQTSIQAAAQAKRRLNTSSGMWATLPPVLGLLHFSDLHGRTTNLERIVQFADACSEYIDDVISTGDQVTDRYSDGYDFWANTSGTEGFLTCIGNHDVLNSESGVWDWTDLVGMGDAYNRYLAPYIAGWGVNYTAGNTYYYKDYTDNHIRLVVLDMMLLDNDAAAQNTWLASTLAGAKTLGYSVVIAEHTPPQKVELIESNFTSIGGNQLGSNTNSWSRLDPMYQDTVQDFIDDDGSFLCWIAGHTHNDFLCVNPDYPSQLFVVVCHAHGGDTYSMQYNDQQRISGDKSMDAFNLVFLDATTKTVKLVRVGADRDLYLRHRGTITIDCQTLEIINSD